MKFTASLSALVFTLAFAQSANAHHRDHNDNNRHNNHYDNRAHKTTWARVVDVDPVYRWANTRVPEEQCWVETVAVERSSHKQNRSRLAGGLIGGAIGHAAGRKHHNKEIGTAIGAVIGVAVGDNIARKKGHRSHTEYRDVEHCEVRHVKRRQKRLVGYDVVYRHHGQLYSTQMDHHPGKRIQVSRVKTKFRSKRHW